MENKKINNPYGIIVFGANGSGKTTLGLELARLLNFKHMDIEDYHFEKSEIPYSVERSQEDCLNLMLSDIKKHGSFVISAVRGDFGKKISRFYQLGIHISAPLEIRLKRIKQREYEKYGERILKGGDMYGQSQGFIDFVTSRSTSKIEQWAETIVCPVIHIDGMLDFRTNVKNIAEQFFI